MIEHLLDGIKFFLMAFLGLGFISMVGILLAELKHWIDKRVRDDETDNRS